MSGSKTGVGTLASSTTGSGVVWGSKLGVAGGRIPGRFDGARHPIVFAQMLDAFCEFGAEDTLVGGGERVQRISQGPARFDHGFIDFQEQRRPDVDLYEDLLQWFLEHPKADE